MTAFVTRTLANAPDVMAPDGSEVRLLAASARGSMAHFRLSAGLTSKAVRHRQVEELWFFLAGAGEMWRSGDGAEETVAVRPGVSISIPPGTAFQFRARADSALEAVAVTMPPWPGMAEAEPVEGIWPSTA